MLLLLLGFPRSGKSTIGKLLKKQLKRYTFLELDHEILARTDYASVQEVFNERVSLWKEKELEVSHELSQRDNLIIATSGAMVENDLNLQYFRESESQVEIVYLQTSLETLSQRLSASLDSDTAEKIHQNLKKIYLKRDLLYREIANHIVEMSDQQTPEKVAEEIETRLL